MMLLPIHQSLVRGSLIAAIYSALLAISISGLVLVGYWADWQWAWRPIPGGRAIHPLGACCLFALGVAAFLMRPGKHSWASVIIALATAMISALLISLTLNGHGDYIDALSPFSQVLVAERKAGLPIIMRPLGEVTIFFLSSAIVLHHSGRSSASQLVVGTASIAPIGALLGFAYGSSGPETLMGPVGAVSSLLTAFAIAGRMAHKIPLRCALTANLPGRLIRLQIGILVGFNLVLSFLAARSKWEEDTDTFGIEVAVLTVTILLSLVNAAYRWQQEQQRMTAAKLRTLHPLATDLDGAWHRGEIFLLYQPQVRMIDDTLVGVEALARWRHPHLGLISPNDFIPAAEMAGLIEPLGAWIFQTACEQAARWQETGLSNMLVSVNVSALQLDREGSADRLIDIQRRANVPPDRMVIEITESTLMERGGRAVSALRQLRHAGMAIAIDDFGTGFSSLSSLQILPSDYLKIDRSFVMDLPESDTAGMIVQAIVGMGRGLGMEVVAEGVEKIEQDAYLRNIGCEKAQGYFYGKPVYPAEMEELGSKRFNSD